MDFFFSFLLHACARGLTVPTVSASRLGVIIRFYLIAELFFYFFQLKGANGGTVFRGGRLGTNRLVLFLLVLPGGSENRPGSGREANWRAMRERESSLFPPHEKTLIDCGYIYYICLLFFTLHWMRFYPPLAFWTTCLALPRPRPWELLAIILGLVDALDRAREHFRYPFHHFPIPSSLQHSSFLSPFSFRLLHSSYALVTATLLFVCCAPLYMNENSSRWLVSPPNPKQILLSPISPTSQWQLLQSWLLQWPVVRWIV